VLEPVGGDVIKSGGQQGSVAVPTIPPYPYEELAAKLRSRIRDGTYPPWSKLPSRRKLAEEFEVSDTVVGGALRELQREHLTVSRSGAGTWVLGPGDPPDGWR
jgi:DNA-binding GntR family transcriptional regulator